MGVNPKEYWLNTNTGGYCERESIAPKVGAVHVVEAKGYVEARLSAAKLVEALKFIKSRTHSDPLCIEELNVRAARVYEAADKALRDWDVDKTSS